MTAELDQYILDHIDAEGEYLHALWRDTQLRLAYGQMASGHLQGRLLKMLVTMKTITSTLTITGLKIQNSKKTRL